MRRSPHRARPAFFTVSDVQGGPHYAMHTLQGEPSGARYHLVSILTAHMDEKLETPCRGIPTTFNYRDGALRVWPSPADGWRVFAEVSGKDVTPE